MSDLPDGVTRDRYCSPAVDLESCHALYIELEQLEDLRFQFMYWRGLNTSPPLQTDKARLRDLRPGDVVVFEGWRRVVRVVRVFRQAESTVPVGHLRIPTRQ